MAVAFRRCSNNHLGALPCRCKRRGVAVQHQLLFALRTLYSDLAHRLQNRLLLFIGSQQGKAGFAGQFNIDRKPVRQKTDTPHQFRVRAGDGFGVDIAVEMIFLPQNAQRLDHAFHRIIRRTDDRTGKEKPFNVITLIKADCQFCKLPRGKGRTGYIVGAAVDTITAIITAGVGIQHFQQRNAAAVRGKGMADARLCAAAQAAVLSGTLHAAGGAGHIIFGAVRQYLKLFRKVHSARLLKKGYKKYSPPHILA